MKIEFKNLSKFIREAINFEPIIFSITKETQFLMAKQIEKKLQKKI